MLVQNELANTLATIECAEHDVYVTIGSYVFDLCKRGDCPNEIRISPETKRTFRNCFLVQLEWTKEIDVEQKKK